jgi:hypothetical protein
MFSILLGLINAQGFNPYEGSMMVCEGLWGRQSIPFANEKASIQVNVRPLSESGSVTLAIFRYEDKNHFISGNTPIAHICDLDRMQSGRCKGTDLGRFIFDDKPQFLDPIMNESIHWHDVLGPEVSPPCPTAEPDMDMDTGLEKRQNNGNVPAPTTSAALPTETEANPLPTAPSSIHDFPLSNLTFNYHVHENGFYCVLMIDDGTDAGQDYEVDIFVASPYGKLPAIFFPALPFFATSFAVYSLIGIVWATVSYMNRNELLPIQNLIAGLILFLIIENAVNMMFFIDFNNHGFVSRLFLGIMVTFNAARNSFSFFMVLVVSLGYGVVFPSLGKKMYVCIALGVAHFVFGAIYFTTSMLSKDVNSAFVFLIGLPLSISLMAFYIWILVGITDTVKYLESKRQGVKLEMYQKLSYILTASVVLLVFIFIANTINLSFRHNAYWIANQWKWRWLLLDGLLNVNFFSAFVSIAYIWMPTTNNARLGLMQLDSEDIEDPRDFVELNSPYDDEHILEWAEQNVNDAPIPPAYVTDKLMKEEDMEELN